MARGTTSCRKITSDFAIFYPQYCTNCLLAWISRDWKSIKTWVNNCIHAIYIVHFCCRVFIYCSLRESVSEKAKFRQPQILTAKVFYHQLLLAHWYWQNSISWFVACNIYIQIFGVILLLTLSMKDPIRELSILKNINCSGKACSVHGYAQNNRILFCASYTWLTWCCSYWIPIYGTSFGTPCFLFAAPSTLGFLFGRHGGTFSQGYQREYSPK